MNAKTPAVSASAVAVLGIAQGLAAGRVNASSRAESLSTILIAILLHPLINCKTVIS